VDEFEVQNLPKKLLSMPTKKMGEGGNTREPPIAASIAIDVNMYTMGTRGVRISALQDIAEKLEAFCSGERVWYDGQSGVKLGNTFQARALVENRIVRTEITLTDEQWLQVKRMKVAVGDRVKNGVNTAVITAVNETGEYTLTLLKSEKHKHEANYAFWDWSGNTLTLTDTDFTSGKYTRDREMTTKDAMEEVTKAMTLTQAESYVDLLARNELDTVGKANRFVSHAWKYRFEDVINSLAAHVDPSDYLWFDICTVNQHVTKHIDFQTTFKEAVGDIGHTLLVMAPWENPIPLTRSWCIWEIFSTLSSEKTNLEVVLIEEVEFVKKLCSTDEWYDMFRSLFQLKSEGAKAGNLKDQEAIYDAVKETDGFKKVNEKCREGIKQGLVEIATRKLDKLDTMGEEKWSFMANVATLLYEIGKLAAAEKLCRSALEKCKGTLEQTQTYMLTFEVQLVPVLQAQDKLKEAEPFARRALDEAEKCYRPMHPTTLICMNNLASVLQAQGKLEEAEPLFRRALEGTEKKYDPEHPDTLDSVNNLAGLLQAQGKLKEAEPLFRRVLKGTEKKNGEDHPDTLDSVNNLAGLLKEQDKLEEAEPLFRRALEGREKNLGSMHPDTLTSVENLAGLLQAQGKEEERKHLIQRFALDAEATVKKRKVDKA
jgi:tetratricopeptide (TPR) repeat protein